MANSKNGQRVSKRKPKPPTRQPPCRTSARLKGLHDIIKQQESERSPQLPTPPVSFPDPNPSKKRRRSDESSSQTELKRARLTSEDLKALQSSHGSVEHWIMSNYTEKRRDRTVTESQDSTRSSKRRTSSTHTSTHHAERKYRMEDLGIHMTTSASLQPASKELCAGLLRGNRTPSQGPGYPIDKIPQILEKLEGYSEARLQRDVTSWVAPSPLHLYLSGDMTCDWIGEELNADWYKCMTLGSSRPKPDCAFGLLRNAFTGEENRKLATFASPAQPTLFTPNIYFPFLICEAKTGQAGLTKADQQNIHSGSIAVRAIIRLFTAAFGATHDEVQKLYGTVLVFTISHDNRIANIYGHYAVASDETVEGLEFFRYDIAIASFSTNEGKDKFVPYNFVRNLFDDFAPVHRARICRALLELPARERTTLPVPTFYSAGDETDPWPESPFKLPSEPASHSSELAKIQSQLEQQKKESKEREEMMQQIKEREETMKQQIKEGRERMERLERQLGFNSAQ